MSTLLKRWRVRTIWVVAAVLVLWPHGLAAQDLELDRGRAHDMLRFVAEDVEKNFYDPNLNGLDWKSLVSHAQEHIDKAKSRSEMYAAIFFVLSRLQDSHTFFIPPTRAAEAQFGFEAMPFGDEIRVYKLDKDGVADKAGLKVGDRLVGINKFRAERKTWDVMMLDFHVLRPVAVMDVSFVRGNGQVRDVRLEGETKQGLVVRDWTLNGWNELRREAAERASHEEKVRSEDYDDGTAYLRVPSFMVEEDKLDDQVRKVSKSRALIIDLRLNHGGRQDMLTRLAGYFEAEPTVMGELQQRKKNEQLKIKPQHPALSMPLFVLVDSETGSAAEMFARHFQRSGRARVIGDRTSGRVNEAKVFSHHSGTDTIVPYGVEVAVGRLILPGGEELERHGVAPDQLCIPNADDQVAGRDPCLNIAKTMAAKAGAPTAKP